MMIWIQWYEHNSTNLPEHDDMNLTRGLQMKITRCRNEPCFAADVMVAVWESQQVRNVSKDSWHVFCDKWRHMKG